VSSSALAQPATLHLFANADGGILESEDNGKLSGLSVELLTTAMNRSAIAFDVTLVPWKRALETARNEDNACAFTAVRTEEREKSFQWIGPLQHNALVVYSLESNPAVIRSVEDLRNYKVGGMVGEAITEMLLSKGIAVDALTGEDVNGRNLTRLKLGRIDFWVRSSIHAAYYAAKQPDIKIKPTFVIQKLGNYLACNLKVSDQLVAKVNATLAQMLKDGTTKSIFNAYNLSP
jgi:polar amino acid transport system substrate-binding protein